MPGMHIRAFSRFGRVLLAGLLATACAPARLLDAVTPDGAYTRTADIAYGTLARQKLDLYRPMAADPRRTAVIFFYGGGWRSGEKGDYRFVAESLTRRGLTVIIPDYRIHPEAVFPAFVEDGARAVRWTRDNAEALGIDPERIFLMGHSAGAHIAALVALDPRYLAGVGAPANAVSGVVGIAGPYDFLPIVSPSVREVFGAVPNLVETQPISFVRSDAPPMLLVHGMEDRTVYSRNSERLAERLMELGASVRLVRYVGRGHVDIMLGLSSVFMGEGHLMRDIAEFFSAPDVS